MIVYSVNPPSFAGWKGKLFFFRLSKSFVRDRERELSFPIIWDFEVENNIRAN
jgi:hypothetical protein